MKQHFSIVRTKFLIKLVLANSSNYNLILASKYLTLSRDVANTSDFK